MGGRLRRELLIATEGRQLLFSRTSYAQSFTLNRIGPPASAAPPAPAVNPGRIVELSKAYAFAQENKYQLPVGLVAVRPASGQDSFKVGSFKAMTRNKYGRYPCVVIVMSIEKGDKADVIWSGTGYDGKPAWRYYAGSHEGNRIRLFSATGGMDSDELLLEWKSPTSASFSMHNKIGTTTMFSTDMVKLDG